MNEKDIKICGHGSGTPSVKNLYTYCATRQSTSWNGTNKGLVEVRRFLDKSQAANFALFYSRLIGRNNYSQNLRTYVYTPYTNGKYYSDCSSSGDATYRLCGKDVGWINTEAMHYNGEKVNVKIENGHIAAADLTKLQLGDALLFRGNASRVLNIGHVEYIYELGDTSKVIGNYKKGAKVEPVEYINNGNVSKLKSGSMLTVLIDNLAIRDCPDYSARPCWYRTNKGYISAYQVEGWILDSIGWWYDRKNHDYYKQTVAKIASSYYAFRPDGYMATHIDSSGAIC